MARSHRPVRDSTALVVGARVDHATVGAHLAVRAGAARAGVQRLRIAGELVTAAVERAVLARRGVGARVVVAGADRARDAAAPACERHTAGVALVERLRITRELVAAAVERAGGAR